MDKRVLPARLLVDYVLYHLVDSIGTVVVVNQQYDWLLASRRLELFYLLHIDRNKLCEITGPSVQTKDSARAGLGVFEDPNMQRDCSSILFRRQSGITSCQTADGRAYVYIVGWSFAYCTHGMGGPSCALLSRMWAPHNDAQRRPWGSSYLN